MHSHYNNPFFFISIIILKVLSWPFQGSRSKEINFNFHFPILMIIDIYRPRALVQNTKMAQVPTKFAGTCNGILNCYVGVAS